MNLKEFLNKSINKKNKLYETYIFEGIDVDLNTKTVKFNDTHENLVDTSLNNPTEKTIDGIKTISIFKRKKSKDKLISDGNPLVYAMKNLKGWKISKNDEKLIFKRIQEIINKLGKFDTIILVPSSNPLSYKFSKYINGNIIEKCLTKRTKDEILDDMPWQNFTKDELKKIEDAFDKMDYWFESKHFPKDKNIINKMEVNLFNMNKGLNLEISNKNVLVVDDVISSGLSLSNCTKTIKECYMPKSIMQLSLFSDL